MKTSRISKLFTFVLCIISLAVIVLGFTLKSKAEDVVYETPDIVSISDLTYIDGKPVGTKVILSEHLKFKYESTAENYSTIFKFKYKVLNQSTINCQIHFSDTWTGDEHGGIFWFRDDANRISKPGKGQYEVGSKFASTGTYDVELGKLYIESGANAGSYYMYMKVDGSIIVEIIQPEMPAISAFFTTGSNGDMLIDEDYTGSKVTYMVDGTVSSEFNTLEDYLTKPADPVVPGKTFIGWFDEMGLEWNFDKDPVRDNLVLKAGFASSEGSSDEVYFNDSTYTPVLRFMVSSDVHFAASQTNRDTNLVNAFKAAYKYAESNKNYSKLDAALFVGDIADSGDEGALKNFKATALANIKSGTQLLVSMGNHDFRSATPQESIAQFANLFGDVDRHTVINGYHFIYLSPDTSNGEHFTNSKAVWLDAELKKAEEADPTKPIFLMQHEGIQGTIYGSHAWGVSELTDVISKYPQVVDFSGHSHYPIADPRSIWQGTFTALGTGTLHYYEMGINGYKNSGVFPLNKEGGWKPGPSDGSSAAEFLIVEIDANNAMRVIGYDVMSGTEICRYYMRNLMDEVKVKYSHIERAKSSVKPSFPETAKLELSSVMNSITVQFDQATCVDKIDSYHIQVFDGTKLVKTEYALSDFYFFPNPTKLKIRVESLSSLKEYKIRVYAVNVWGDVSDDYLEGTITTKEAEAERLGAYDTISVNDLTYPNTNGIIENIPTEYTATHYYYNGTSPTYSVKFQYYLITGEIQKTDEFRTQVGTRESYFCTVWIQQNKLDKLFYSWKYSDRPSDGLSFEIQNNGIYRIETSTIYVEAGENEGKGLTTLVVTDMLNPSNTKTYSFYCNMSEAQSEDYEISMHVSTNYKIADISLARNIEYYVDGAKTKTVFAVNGLTTTEPERPSKPGYYFVGWYTDPVGGERVDFRNPVSTESETIKYYARFTDQTYNVKFYSEGSLYEDQVVGKDCQAFVPEIPTKTGVYKYSFVEWVIKGTDEPFDFSSIVTGDLELEAKFEEYKYKIVYRADGLEYTIRYFVESDPTTIIGGEPEVPEIKGAIGRWVYSSTRDKSDIYAVSMYDGIKTTPTGDITLNAFNGKKVDIADDLTRYYLSFTDTVKQGEWLSKFPVSGGHERQNLTFSWKDTARNTQYIVYFADNADFNNAFIVKTDKKSLDYVGIFTPGKTYYWKVLGVSTNSWTEVDTFTVLDTPVRWISAGTVFNMRDLGGWTTMDGKTVKYGLIYRGAQLAIDQTGEKSFMNDYSYKVFDYLGMKTEIELRGDRPHDYNQFNDLEQVLSVNGKGYAEFFNMEDKAKGQYRQLFELLADINNYPIYFHCSWGADRTGGLGFLIGAILGMPYEQLMEDYELTSLSNSGLRSRYTYSGGAFQAMYDKFMKDYSRGGTIQDAVTRYLINYVGVTQEQIDSIKSIMLTNSEAPITTHVVTYMIDGKVYQESKVFDGELVKEVVPFFMEKHLKYWTLNGEPFDPNTKVTTDLVLEAAFEETRYEEYDTITVRDLGLGETFSPSMETVGLYMYEGTSPTGSVVFVFDYEITSASGAFNDGVHVAIGPDVWDWKAQVWFASASSQHLFTGSETPTASYNRFLTYGQTYRITYGVIIPIDGEYAGKKMLLLQIDDEVVAFLPTPTSLKYLIGFAGTQGVLKSVDNDMKVSFIGADGLTVIDSSMVQRGNKVNEIETPAAPLNKVFAGWYDALGNKWDFDKNKVLKNMELFAKFDDRTIGAVVIDTNNIEIQHDYKVKLGMKVSEIEIPIAKKDNLKFKAWYNKDTLLTGDDVITEDMELICVFEIVDVPVDPIDPIDPVDPIDPIDPVDPVKPENKGCKKSLSLSFGFMPLFALALTIFKKKRRER